MANRLKLSNVAVVLAFAVGAELAGVVGALIALPIAAAYPAIERIWLREQVGEETVREHKAIAAKPVRLEPAFSVKQHARRLSTHLPSYSLSTTTLAWASS